MSSSCRKLYVALGAGALLGLGHGARADNWELVPRVEGGGTYNDNYRMANTSADKLQVYGPYIDALLNAHLISQVSKLEIVPRIRSDLYPTDHADQSTDGYLDIDGDYKTQRSDFTGVAQYANQTVIYSELLPATFPGLALGQVVTARSGLVSVRNREQLEHVVPSFTYDITQRTHLNLQAAYDHASFNSGNVQQVGFSNYGGQAGLQFNVTPLSTLSVYGTGARFQPQSGGHAATTYGVNLQWDVVHSQIAHFYARIGDSRTRSDVTTTTTVTTPPARPFLPPTVTQVTTNGSVTNNGVTGGVGVDLRYQITEVTVDVLRALAPSDAGAEIVSDEVRFRVLHAFQPRFSGFLGVRGVRVRGASTGTLVGGITGEDYLAAEGGCDYQLTQSFRLEGKYDLTWQRFQGTSSATSNAVGLAIIYQPLSRYEPLPELTGIPHER
ncbi:MAG: hypothetical protein KGL45_03385, partial [Gammaproteobacteria bacterium]|nr:hypothetical protein [Gammaproteobacteria bacterium]